MSNSRAKGLKSNTKDKACVLKCETYCSTWLKLSADRTTIVIPPLIFFVATPLLLLFFCFVGRGPTSWLHLSSHTQTHYWSRRGSFSTKRTGRICCKSAYSYFMLCLEYTKSRQIGYQNVGLGSWFLLVISYQNTWRFTNIHRNCS